MQKLRPLSLCCFFLLLPGTALGAALGFVEVPETLRPGKSYTFYVETPYGDLGTLTLQGKTGEEYVIVDAYPMSKGQNIIPWDGYLADNTPVPEGDYTLILSRKEGGAVGTKITIGAPYPSIHIASQSTFDITHDTLHVHYTASEAGTLTIQRKSHDTNTALPVTTVAIEAGDGQLAFSGMVYGEPTPPGTYSLMITLETASGEQSAPQHAFFLVQEGMDLEATGRDKRPEVQVLAPEAEPVKPVLLDSGTADGPAEEEPAAAPPTEVPTKAPTERPTEPPAETPTPIPVDLIVIEPTPTPTVEPEPETSAPSERMESIVPPEPTPTVETVPLQTALDEVSSLRNNTQTLTRRIENRPYSTYEDDSYWSLRPGETDDAAIWEVMMQPLVVFDNGVIGASGHAYLMENPDGTGARVAQIHGLSQGLHVIGNANEHGYVQVEAFSNYDLSYQPRTEYEREHAFELKRGYIKAEYLRYIGVNQEMAFLVDKLTQRMYVFINGERVTELLISTGNPSYGKIYRETIPGEFVTISKTGGYWSNGYYSDLSIRINGGTLIHEIPYTINASGNPTYHQSEPYLGTKRSAGCVRVQRAENPDGFNMRWLWNNIKSGEFYKVLIWDDTNRYDMPDVWYPHS